jgi:hypothetical protein
LGQGANDYWTEARTNVTALKWYDNKPMYLVSSDKGRHPVEKVIHGIETNYEEKELVGKR